jgi:hypothetical protein
MEPQRLMLSYLSTKNGVGLVGMWLAITVCATSGGSQLVAQDSRIPIGLETTYFIKPLKQDGTVDYVRIINDAHGKNVEPKENAVVLLYQATGRLGQSDSFFAALGIPDFKEPERVFQQPDEKVDSATYDRALEEPWTAELSPALVQWLDQNQQAMELVSEATRKTHYYSPWVIGEKESLFSVLLPGCQRSREIARAFVIRAMFKLGKDDVVGAWEDFMVVHRLGRLVGRGPSIIELLVGFAIEQQAVSGEQKVLARTTDASQLKKFSADLESLLARDTVKEKVNFGERVMFLDWLTKVANGIVVRPEIDEVVNALQPFKDAPMDYILANLDWCETLRRFNNHYNEITRHFDKEGYIHHIQKVDIKRKYSSAETILVLKQTDGIRKLKSAELTEHFAPFLIEILQPEIGSLFEAQLKTEQFFSHVRIAVALSRWRQEHGSYPESLDEMVPKILDEDPMDQFIDEPLFYEKTAEGCRFYSVGVNATDNHGREDDLQVSLRDPGAAKK